MRIFFQSQIVAVLFLAGSLAGCSTTHEPSAISKDHQAYNEPETYPPKHDLVYALTLLLNNEMQDVIQKLKDPALNEPDRTALRSLGNEINEDLVFALPFVSNAMDHPDQLRVMHYLYQRQRYYRNELERFR